MGALIKYLGTSPDYHVDSIGRTSTVWHGTGDVQEVLDMTEDKARLLADLHPGLYEVVDTASPQDIKMAGIMESEHVRDVMIEDHDGRRVPLKDASRKALAAYASDELGLSIMDGHTKVDILNAIANFDEIHQQMMGPEGGGEVRPELSQQQTDVDEAVRRGKEQEEARLKAEEERKAKEAEAARVQAEEERKATEAKLAAEAEAAAAREAEKAASETAERETQEITQEDIGEVDNLF